MSHSEKAVVFFKQGYNCAQATAAAFADELGLDEDAVLRMMAGFGAGVGGLRETCGAVSAMVFIAGVLAGHHAPNDREAKKSLYTTVRQMAKAFADKHGTTNCAELLRSASCQPATDPAERNDEYYVRRPCARFVASAAEIISRTFRLHSS